MAFLSWCHPARPLGDEEVQPVLQNLEKNGDNSWQNLEMISAQ